MKRDKAAQNWERARRCNELAEQARDPDLKAQFQELAAQWVELAIKREKLRHVAMCPAVAINVRGNKLESMAENDETPAVTIEVEMTDFSEEPEGSFESVIKVRISGSERHACELVKEAVLLAIQTALGGDEAGDAPTEPMH